MLNSYARRHLKHRRRYRNRMIIAGAGFVVIAGLAALAMALVLANVRLPPPFPDVRKYAFMVLIGLLGIGSVLYWGVVSAVVWRWSRANTRRSRLTPTALQTTHVLPRWAPRSLSSALSRRRGRVPSVALSAAEFEKEVAWVFGTLFKLRAEVVGRSKDGGVDVKLYDSGGTLVGIIQAKHYNEKKALSPSFLRELDSCKHRMGVAQAYLVTTAHFSSAFRQQARDMEIDLVDGATFEEWRNRAYASVRK